MPLRPAERVPGPDASNLCDSGARAPHPWGSPDSAFGPDLQPWHIDPWQTMDADYRTWQQARYRQLADEFHRPD
ncbi:hypothetical protein AACH06_01440 [Ideonella sp. DXS29W]|uniref:Uncharacterized protein n=1 Tax=Ideonella lacteola TaxID=2984193 RepID=A0ABU9BHP5_9BURK